MDLEYHPFYTNKIAIIVSYIANVASNLAGAGSITMTTNKLTGLLQKL